MNTLESKYPLLFLTLASPEFDDEDLILPDLDKRYCFVFAPVVTKTLEYVENILKKDPTKHIFWIAQGGNYADCQNFETFLCSDSCDLFCDIALEYISMQCAFKTQDLDFGCYVFKKGDSFKAYTEELMTRYILDFYLVNEKKELGALATHILKNLSDPASWYHLKQAKNAFSGVPLVIMGAGSSLDDYISLIKAKGSQIATMAIGSALAICHDEGLRCDMGVISCPNNESAKRLKHKIDCRTLFVQPRCHSDLFLSYQGKKVVLNQTVCFGFEKLKELLGTCPIDENLPDAASTVASLGMEIAAYLGFYPIILCGIDLQYGKKQYAGSIQTDLHQERFIPEIKVLQDIASRYEGVFYRLGDTSHFECMTPMSAEEFQNLAPLSFDISHHIETAFELITWDKQEYLDLFTTSLATPDDESSLAFTELLCHLDQDNRFSDLFKFSS